MQADDLHNEETATPAPPLSRTQWENSKRRYEELLPDGPAWPGDPTYEAYCEKMAQLSKADAAHNYCNSTGKELPQITIRPALAKDFPTLLQIRKDRYQFDATRAGVDKSRLPTFESQLETLTQSLVSWIAAGQCFLMEANGRPGAWFVLQLPAPDAYPVATKRKGGARATASTPLPRATMLGPYASPRFAGASKHMLAFCQACCPRLAIEVPLDDPLSRFRLAYWRSALSPMYEFLVISYRVESFLKSPGGNRRFWPPVSMPSENITRVFGLSKSPGLLKSIFFFRGLLATGQNYGQLYSLRFKVGVNP